MTEDNPQAVVFTGSLALCKEYSLVLLARGVEHELLPNGAHWSLIVPPGELRRAYEELGRYALERRVRRPTSRYAEPMPGALYGVIGYTVILLFVAYCAGISLFHADWLAVGALDSSPAAHVQWWRPLTALTLHSGPGHLLSNLAFGLLAGSAAARLVGAGVAWAAGLIAAGLANAFEMLISPITHRAVGASTLVFALLGLITGLALRDNEKSRERIWRRWGPVAAGLALLALTGGGGADLSQGGPPQGVDVLGHLLGFLFGALTGWLLPQLKFDARSTALQIACGAAAVSLAALAWSIALLH